MKKNQKGFTLIELLAVIVILAVLLAIAIPAVSKYINTAKKSTYKENVQSYAKAAKTEFANINSDYQLPVNGGDAVVLTFADLEYAIENGGKVSSYNGTFNDTTKDNSCVVVVNDGDANNPHYTYYIAAKDSKNYSIGVGKDCKLMAYDAIKEDNIIQTSNAGIKCKDVNDLHAQVSDITSLYDGKTGNLIGSVQ